MALVGLELGAGGVRFDPEVGTRVVRAFAFESELATTSVRATDLEAVPVVDGNATETTSTTWKAVGGFAWDVERRTLRSLAVEVRSTVVTVRYGAR